MSVFFGYHMPNFSFQEVRREHLFDHVAGLAQAAEAAGFDLVTVMDHFYQIRGVGPETEPMLEAYTTLGGLAARTTDPPRDSSHGCDLSQPGAAREDGHDARHRLRGPGHPWYRRRLERGRAPRVWLRLSSDRPAHGQAG